MVISPNPVHLTSARPKMSHQQCFNSRVSSCTFLQACREWEFHVPIVVPSFGSVMVAFAPVAHLPPPPWSITLGCTVLAWSSTSLLSMQEHGCWWFVSYHRPKWLKSYFTFFLNKLKYSADISYTADVNLTISASLAGYKSCYVPHKLCTCTLSVVKPMSPIMLAILHTWHPTDGKVKSQVKLGILYHWLYTSHVQHTHWAS